MTLPWQYPPDEPVDVVVIGTGAGGAPVMAKLARAGVSVVALEAGPVVDPKQYVQDDLKAGIYWTDERLSAGRTPTAFGLNNSGTGVGGSTLHYGAYAPRPDPRDLRLRTENGVGVDWPLTLDELRPYLIEAEVFLGVSGPRHYPWDPDRRYPLPPVALNGPAQLMERGCRAIGVRTAQAPLLTLSQHYQQDGYAERPPCAHCGYCHQGCFNSSKASMDVTYLPAAVAAGAEIRPGAFVHGFERDGTGRISAVVYRQNGKDHRQKCRAVFLCAGAVETPRLLLHIGLANSSGQVGRNFMVHMAGQVWGTFGESVRMTRGFPASLITEDTVRPPDADFAGGYLIQSLGTVPLTFANAAARGRGLWGPKLIEYLKQMNHVAGIGINGECLPDQGNYLELSDEPDTRGLIPKPRIHFSAGENEDRLRAHADRLMRRIWQAAGATDVWSMDRTAHTIGTCRMGHDRDAAVVDPVGRSYDIDNLWVSDNSTFPSSLIANPALTIIALALRSADAFLRNGRGAA